MCGWVDNNSSNLSRIWPPVSRQSLSEKIWEHPARAARAFQRLQTNSALLPSAYRRTNSNILYSWHFLYSLSDHAFFHYTEGVYAWVWNNKSYEIENNWPNLLYFELCKLLLHHFARWINLQSTLKVFNCVISLSHPIKRNGTVVVEDYVTRTELNSLCVSRNRLIISERGDK